MWSTSRCCSLAVPTLIPCAMFMLIASDTSSTSIILNGLSIGFTLELDQQLPFAFLSARQLDEIDNFLTTTLKGREYRRARAGPTATSSCRYRASTPRRRASLPP